MQYTALTGLYAALISVLLASCPAVSLAGEHKEHLERIDGEIYVYGAMTENACRLETDSAWQRVDMGNISTARLQNPGDRGRPVSVTFQLKDCLPAGARNVDGQSNSLLWGREQPAMNMRFLAVTDSLNPELIALKGVSGLGLRLQDSEGRDIHPDGQGRPVLLDPGQNALTYTLTPVRTLAPLQGGAWHSLINVGLDYE